QANQGGLLTGEGVIENQLQPKNDEQQRPQVAQPLEGLRREHAGVREQNDDSDGDQNQREKQTAAPVHRVPYRRRSSRRRPSRISTAGQKRSQRTLINTPRLVKRK